jgi:hypothetical protein
MTVLITGEKRHHCDPPVQNLDIPTLPVGSIWECDDCGQVWACVNPQRVYAGQQRVPPLWRKATRREARRARRASRG